MSDAPIHVYGASGHGKVVADAARRAARCVVAYLDDDPSKHGTAWDGLPVLGGPCALPPLALVALGIGSNEVRRRIAGSLRELGHALETIVHPTAALSRGVILGHGVFVGPLAVVHVDARVGEGAVVNSGAIVEHDSSIGSWCHVAPGSVLGGSVAVGEGALIGLGARVLPGVSIGAWAVVGAGAVVTRPVPDGATVVGTPARRVGT
jgi:sugar O-acyltransferase (sialic acid O-acetyltransferase NeuD family)